jgi:hypothetical protein
MLEKSLDASFIEMNRFACALKRRSMMNDNTSNKPKGCLSWMSGIGAAVVGLLTAGASCAAILQYMNSTTPSQPASSNPPAVVVITSEPVSNNVQSGSAQTSVSVEEWDAIESFVIQAVVAEITAYQYGDPSYATMFYGDALQALQGEILDLNSRGLLMDPHFDYDNSYLNDIRVGQNHIEVDSCEYWSSDYYDRLTGQLVGSDPSALVPQTITIEYLNENFYITAISFHTGQAFCQ